MHAPGNVDIRGVVGEPEAALERAGAGCAEAAGRESRVQPGVERVERPGLGGGDVGHLPPEVLVQ